MDEPRTLVCAACKSASCWWGIFYCDQYRNVGLARATEAQLRALELEHPDYFMRPLKDGHDNPDEPLLEDLDDD